MTQYWRKDTFIHNGTGLHLVVLGVVLAEEIDVPWPLDVELAIATDVDEVVRVVSQDSSDGERPLPWRGELLHAFSILDQA